MNRHAHAVPLQPHPTAAAAAPQWSEAGVAVALDEHRFLLDDGRVARQAPSCVVLPEAGDKVLVAACAADNYIVHLLARAAADSAQLGVPGAQALRIRQARISLHASDAIALRALRDIDISAATGLLALNANNLYATVNEALVASMRHYVGRAEHYQLDIAGLLRLHGEQAMLLADHDIKIDATRVSVG